MRNLSLSLSGCVVCILLLAVTSCTDKYPVVNEGDIGQSSGSGCIDCHTNKELLMQVATPLPPDTGGSSSEG